MRIKMKKHREKKTHSYKMKTNQINMIVSNLSTQKCHVFGVEW